MFLSAAPIKRGPGDDFWYQPVGLPAAAGVRVTRQTALAVSALYACVQVLSQDLGKVPCVLYRRKGKGKERATDHPLYKLLHRVENGEGRPKDIDLLFGVANNIVGKTLCAFGDAAATPVLTTVKLFRAEYEAHVREGRCTLPAPWRATARAAAATRRHS